jgi:hypothetical protein
MGQWATIEIECWTTPRIEGMNLSFKMKKREYFYLCFERRESRELYWMYDKRNLRRQISEPCGSYVVSMIGLRMVILPSDVISMIP